MKTTRLMLYATAALVAALAGGARTAHADYAFTAIAVSGGPFSSLNDPAINNAGTVAFTARTDSGDPGVFKGSGGAPTTIASAADGFTDFGHAAINDAGRVAVRATNADGDVIVSGGGGALTTIAATGGDVFGFGDAAIDASGRVAFLSNSFNGPSIQAGTGGPLETIVDTTADFGGLDSPTINAGGTVAFHAFTASFDEGVFKSDGGNVATTIADSTATFSFFGSGPSINAGGAVAFQAGLNGGGQGIFLGNGTMLTTVAASAGPFRFFDDPSINGPGGVAFSATLDSGVRGIFTGPDVAADKVIAVGDSLLGSSVTGLFATDRSLNDAGQIAFFAQLADGREGIFRADLRAVPEPSSIALLGAGLTACGLWARRRRRCLPQSNDARAGRSGR